MNDLRAYLNRSGICYTKDSDNYISVLIRKTKSVGGCVVNVESESVGIMKNGDIYNVMCSDDLIHAQSPAECLKALLERAY